MSRWTADGAVIELVSREWGWRAPDGTTVEMIEVTLSPAGDGRWFVTRWPNGIVRRDMHNLHRFGWVRSLAEVAELGVELSELEVVTRHWLVVSGEDGEVVSRTYLGESVDRDALDAGLAEVGAVPA